jgi:hypothetical protein
MSKKVLKLMNKELSALEDFRKAFYSNSKGSGLRYYFMFCHPGEDESTIKELCDGICKLENVDQFQLFTPTPMSLSTCMYFTGMDPRTGKKVDVVYDYGTKKRYKRMMLASIRFNKGKTQGYSDGAERDKGCRAKAGGAKDRIQARTAKARAKSRFQGRKNRS